MKTKRKELINVILKCLTILSASAIIVGMAYSCKGRTKASDSRTKEIASSPDSSQIGSDSLVMTGQPVPPGAPPPPPPPPPEPYNIKDGDTIWFRVDVYPKFPGGIDAMQKFIIKNITYPEAAKKKNIIGRVVVGFVVARDCKVRDVRIIQGVDPDLDAEALRVIRMMPDFEEPAFNNGRPVISGHWVPVHFELN